MEQTPARKSLPNDDHGGFGGFGGLWRMTKHKSKDKNELTPCQVCDNFNSAWLFSAAVLSNSRNGIYRTFHRMDFERRFSYMLKRFSVILGVFVLLAVASACTAQQKVLLQYNPVPGTSSKYRMVIRGNTVVTAMQRAQRTNLETTMTLEQKVTGVDRDGNIDMTTEILDGTITINDVPTPIPAVGQLIRVKMAKNGEVIETSGMDTQANFNQMQIKFPDKPVGVGDSWDSTIQPNPQLPIPLSVRYTIVGFETVDGHECVKIRSLVTSEQGSAGSINLRVRAEGNIWFAHKRGIMVKNEVQSNMVMVMENDMGGGQMEKIDTRMNLNLSMGLIK